MSDGSPGLFQQAARASGLFGHLLNDDEQSEGAPDTQSQPSFRVAQALAPFLTLFARPPVIVQRQLTPLEELPKGLQVVILQVIFFGDL
jgi:hypothetical protein